MGLSLILAVQSYYLYCSCNILEAPARLDRHATLSSGSLLPGPVAYGGFCNREVCTTDVILGSPSRQLKEAVEPRTGPLDWWNETTCNRHLGQVGTPRVVSLGAVMDRSSQGTG
jgi:hypothetical protein